MRRIVVLLAAMALMVVMMAVSAAPALAFPNDPTRGLHGREVSTVARFVPPNPIIPNFHGQAVSSVATGSAQCSVFVDNCPVT